MKVIFTAILLLILFGLAKAQSTNDDLCRARSLELSGKTEEALSLYKELYETGILKEFLKTYIHLLISNGDYKEAEKLIGNITDTQIFSWPEIALSSEGMEKYKVSLQNASEKERISAFIELFNFSSENNVRFNEEIIPLYSNSADTEYFQTLYQILDLYSEGNYDEAALSLEDIRTTDEPLNLQLVVSEIYYTGKRKHDAVKILKKIDPELISEKWKLAEAWYKVGDFRKASEYYLLEIEANPWRFEVYMNAATALSKIGKKEMSSDLIEKYCFWFPDNVLGLKQSADIYFAEKLYDRSIEKYTKALEYSVGDITLFNGRGNAYLESEDAAKADFDFGMALDLDPNNPEANFGKGLSCIILNRTKEACYYLTKARSLGIEESDIYILQHCR